MKNFRASALLLVSVIALFGWLWWREREPALPPGVQVVARFAPDKITRIVLKTAGKPTLQLQKEGDEWKIAPQVLAGQNQATTAVFADAEKVRDFLHAFAVLRSEMVLSAAKNDEYGLDAPRVSVELDGQTITFGAPPFFDNQRIYARVDERVTLLPRVLAQAAARPLEEWRDYNVVRFTPDDVAHLTLKRGQQEIALVKLRPAKISPSIGGENWTMIHPRREAADSEHIETLLQTLQAAQVQKFLEIDGQNWGFDKPSAQISINDDVPLLTLGRKLQNGYAAYGRLKNAPFVVSEDVAQTLLRPVDFWRSHRLLSFDLDAIKRVKMSTREQELEYVRDGARWKTENSPAPSENAATVGDILVAVRDWRTQSFIDTPSSAPARFRDFVLSLDSENKQQELVVWRVGKEWRASVSERSLEITPRPIYVLPAAAIANLNALVDRLLAPTPTPAPARVGPHL